MSSTNTRWTVDACTKADADTTISSEAPTNTGTVTFDGNTLRGSSTSVSLLDNFILQPATDSTSAFELKNQAGTSIFKIGTSDALTTLGGNLCSSGARVSILDQVTITPAADSTTSFLVEDSSGNDFFSIDTTNDRVGIGHSSPDTLLHIESATPYLTLANSSGGNGEGDRASKILFEGKQAGGTLGHLAEIKVSHEGTDDDKKGKFELFLNDGDDSDGSLTSMMNLNSVDTSNFLIGKNAGFYNRGHSNVAIGEKALYNGETDAVDDNTGNYNVAIGVQAMGSNTGTTDADAMTGSNNVAIGRIALSRITSGSSNMAIGQTAGQDISTGSNNMCIGQGAGANITTGGANTLIGSGAGYRLTTSSGQFNTGIGTYSLYKAASDTRDNIAIGYYSIGKGFSDGDVYTSNTPKENVALGNYTLGGGMTTTDVDNDAYRCIAIGNQALYKNTSGQYNTAIGGQALYSNTTGSQNTCIGFEAGYTATDGNTALAIGHQALKYSQAGTGNFGIGAYALTNATVGEGNTAIGNSSLKKCGAHADSDYNLAIGYHAMQGGHDTVANNTANNNIAIGYRAHGGTTGISTALTANNNVAIGKDSMKVIESGSYNVAIGGEALGENKYGSWNVAIGAEALKDAGTETGDYNEQSFGNVAIGYQAGYQCQYGDANFFLGNRAGRYLGGADRTGGGAGINYGSYNVAIGVYSMTHGGSTTPSNHTGFSNIAIGYASMQQQGGTNFTANNSVSIGHQAFRNIQSASSCIAIGSNALGANQTGNAHIGIGTNALNDLTYTGDVNDYDPLSSIAIGYYAGEKITTGVGNMAIGMGALRTNTTGSHNIAIGGDVMGIANTSGADKPRYNVGVGNLALKIATIAEKNIAIGYQAGDTITTGSSNTLIGYEVDVAATDNYNVKIGHYGGITWKTARITLDSAYTTPAQWDAAHTNAIFTIPAYSHINKAYVTIITNVGGTNDLELRLLYSTDLTISSGAEVTNRTEIIGANADGGAGLVCRSQATKTADSDISATHDSTNKMTWISNIDSNTDNSIGWVGSSPVGFYLAHAGSNTGSDPGTDAVIQVTVEYNGADV